MNTRTMKRSVYVAHEETRRDALRKRCIYRCRLAMITNVTKVAAFVCAIAFVIVAATNVAAEYNGKTLIEEAKTPAIERIAVTTDLTPIMAVATTLEQEIPKEISLSSIQYTNVSQTVSDELEETAEKVVSSINEQEEEKVKETTPATTNTNSTIVKEEVSKPVESEPVEEEATTTGTSETYDPTQPVSLTNRYKHPTYQYTQEDYEYLLMTIVGEAQNCSYEHQMYVGSVVLNRLHSEKYFGYADCIKDVVLAKGQYTCFSGGGAYRTPTDLNIQVAHDLIDNGSALPGNVIFQAEFTQGDGIYVHLGNTYFCYKN